jgi:S-adenosylmethionine:tRNA ribosyltransferase-isomerase
VSDLSDFLKDYSFHLPEELIAQAPAPRREEARLLIIRRNTSKGLPRFEDLKVSDLPSLIAETPQLQESLWVRNRSCVLPARFYVRRPSGSRHEIVLVEEESPGLWKVLMRNTSKMQFPQDLYIEGLPREEAHIISPQPGLIDLSPLKEPLSSILERVGEMPLPPYIKERSLQRDRDRYQTVWALKEEQKSVAAPTASLHFSEELVSKIEEQGIRFADTLLHIGLGTFEPVRCERLSEHKLHSERIYVKNSELRKIETQLQADKPILALGTTALRNLESLPLLHHEAHPELRYTRNPEGDISGRTALFVRPGFEFRYTSYLFTNFHLPQSTLFVLISTFAGSLKLAKEAYDHAIRSRYRFFSYGDASLWL